MSNQGDDQNQPPPPAESDSSTSASEAPVSVIESKLMNIAEELGTWLGTAERKTTDFIAQSDIKEQLVRSETPPRGSSPKSKRGASVRVDQGTRDSGLGTRD